MTIEQRRWLFRVTGQWTLAFTAISIALILIWVILVSVMTQGCLRTGFCAEAMEIRKSDLVGAWVYIDSYSEFPDGRKEVLFGARPAGMFVILPNGYYSHIIMHPGLPRVASGRFQDATIQEAQKIAEGVLAHFGTYTVDERAGTFTVTIQKASFPNVDGAQQVRTVTKLDRGYLSYVNNLSVADTTGAGTVVRANLRRLPD